MPDMTEFWDRVLDQYTVPTCTAPLYNGERHVGFGLAVAHPNEADKIYVLTATHIQQEHEELQLEGNIKLEQYTDIDGTDNTILKIPEGHTQSIHKNLLNGLLLNIGAHEFIEFNLPVLANYALAQGTDTITARLPLNQASSFEDRSHVRPLDDPENVEPGLSGIPYYVELAGSRDSQGAHAFERAYVGLFLAAHSETSDRNRTGYLSPLDHFSEILERIGIPVMDMGTLLHRVLASYAHYQAENFLKMHAPDHWMPLEPTPANNSTFEHRRNVTLFQKPALVVGDGGSGKSVWLARHVVDQTEKILETKQDAGPLVSYARLSYWVKKTQKEDRLAPLEWHRSRFKDIKGLGWINDDIATLLYEFLTAYTNSENPPDQHTFLDGLDQAPSFNNKLLANFIKDHPETIITSRKWAAERCNLNVDIHEYKMQSPSHKQVREFLGPQAYDKVCNHHRLDNQLLRLPLYADGLRSILGNSRDELPVPTRAHYFEKFWNHYINLETQAGDTPIKEPGFADQPERLQRLALRMCLEGHIQQIDRNRNTSLWSDKNTQQIISWWWSLVEGRAFLEIDPPYGGVGSATTFGFIHQNWQEYLAARRIASLIAESNEDFHNSLDTLTQEPGASRQTDLWISLICFLPGALEMEGLRPERGLFLLRELCRRGAFLFGYVFAEEWRLRNDNEGGWAWNRAPQTVHALYWLCWAMIRYRRDIDRFIPTDASDDHLGWTGIFARAMGYLATKDAESLDAFLDGLQCYQDALPERDGDDGPGVHGIELCGMLEILSILTGEPAPAARLIGDPNLLTGNPGIWEWLDTRDQRDVFDHLRTYWKDGDSITVAPASEWTGVGYQPSASALMDWLWQRFEEDAPSDQGNRELIQKALDTMDALSAPWEYREEDKSKPFAHWLANTFLSSLQKEAPPPAEASYPLFNKDWADAIQQLATGKYRDLLEKTKQMLGSSSPNQAFAALQLIRAWRGIHPDDQDLAEIILKMVRKVESHRKKYSTGLLYPFVQELTRFRLGKTECAYVTKHLEKRWCTEVALLDVWVAENNYERWFKEERLCSTTPEYEHKHWYYWRILPIVADDGGGWTKKLVENPEKFGIEIKTKWEQKQREWSKTAIKNVLLMRTQLVQ